MTAIFAVILAVPDFWNLISGLRITVMIQPKEAKGNSFTSPGLSAEKPQVIFSDQKIHVH